MDLQELYKANEEAWDLRTTVHAASKSYGLEGWRKGQNSLQAIELRELGDVQGKTLLHLQCHFGQDTLSWARLGAKVTGVDISGEAIRLARQLAEEEGTGAQFVQCNLFDLPQHLDGQFDIVFTSYGAIGWLPELASWGKLIDRYLAPGGTFYIAEFHPVVWMLDEEFTFVKYPYHNVEPIKTENEGTYADRDAPIRYVDYGWNHSLGEVLNALTTNGLHIDFLNEYPFSPFDCFPKTIQGEDGQYRIKGLENIIPMVFSIKATKPHA